MLDTPGLSGRQSVDLAVPEVVRGTLDDLLPPVAGLTCLLVGLQHSLLRGHVLVVLLWSIFWQVPIPRISGSRLDQTVKPAPIVIHIELGFADRAPGMVPDRGLEDVV